MCSGAVVIGCLGPMVGTVVVAVNPPGPSAQMAIAEAAGPYGGNGHPKFPRHGNGGARAF